VRENEDAARALGVDTLAVKLKAITVSAMLTAAAGCFYTQKSLYLDAGIGFGPWISIDALLGSDRWRNWDRVRPAGRSGCGCSGSAR